jgi:hypothetical protein
LGLIAFFAPHPDWHGDLSIFRTGSETLRHPYYARWLFSALGMLPETLTYILLSLLSVVLLFFSVRIFNGKPWMVFTSYALAWTLFYGQIDAIVLAGLAIAWHALRQQQHILIGAGLIIASIKPQMTIPSALLIWYWSPSKWRPLLIPTLIVLVSFVQWGFWIPAWWTKLRHTPDLINLSRNISLWPIIGGWALLLWPAVLALPLQRPQKLLATMTCTMLTSPYFPFPSVLMVYCLPVPAWSWALGQVPILAGFVGEWIYGVARIIPVSILIWIAWPWLHGQFSKIILTRQDGRHV